MEIFQHNIGNKKICKWYRKYSNQINRTESPATSLLALTKTLHPVVRRCLLGWPARAIRYQFNVVGLKKLNVSFFQKQLGKDFALLTKSSLLSIKSVVTCKYFQHFLSWSSHIHRYIGMLDSITKIKTQFLPFNHDAENRHKKQRHSCARRKAHSIHSKHEFIAFEIDHKVSLKRDVSSLQQRFGKSVLVSELKSLNILSSNLIILIPLISIITS